VHTGRVERSSEVTIRYRGVRLPGAFTPSSGADAVVVFAHGSGSSRFSPRNIAVAESLHARGFGTLLFDLLTEDEVGDRRNVFDIELLSLRLMTAVEWTDLRDEMPVGLFGASTGAAAALVAAAELPDVVRAVVSRGGRPDLAPAALGRVTAPVLLIVGERDVQVLEPNRDAQRRMTATETALEVVPGATHLFEEPGALDEVASLAGEWFGRYLRG
jgi:putative phosphoribosyl transferase